MYAVLFKGCRTELNNMSPNLSAIAFLLRNPYFLPICANLPFTVIPSLLLLIQPLDFISFKILSVFILMMTEDLLSLLEVALLSIYLLLKPLLSKLLTPPIADKKIRVLFKECALMTFFHWSFSSQSRLGLFLQIAAAFFPTLSIPTILLDNCQTKSCFKDMNILIKAILSQQSTI